MTEVLKELDLAALVRQVTQMGLALVALVDQYRSRQCLKPFTEETRKDRDSLQGRLRLGE